MCIEDVRLGRAMTGTFSFGSVGTTAAQLIRGNQRRSSLVISCPATARVTLSDQPGQAIDQGLTLPAGGSPLRLSIQQDGAWITKILYAVGAAGTQTVGWVESELGAE